MARISLEQIKASHPKVDLARIEATDEAEITRHMREDGEEDEIFENPAEICLPPTSAKT
jgi:hypothetical protein